MKPYRRWRVLSGARVEAVPVVRFRAYDILTCAVEEGVNLGLNRAHKHTDTPTREQLAEAVEREVMGALCEILDFETDVVSGESDK